jgi:hypothetical protein
MPGWLVIAAAPSNDSPVAAANVLCSFGWISIVAGTAVVAATSGFIALYSFATADADLSLLLRGKHKRDAFVGKVIWVTGASQVRTRTQCQCLLAGHYN